MDRGSVPKLGVESFDIGLFSGSPLVRDFTAMGVMAAGLQEAWIPAGCFDTDDYVLVSSGSFYYESARANKVKN